VVVHRLRDRNPMLAVQAWRLTRTLRPDLVQVHFAMSLLGTRYIATVLAALMARRRLGTRLVVTSHEVVREIEILGPFAKAFHRAVVALSDAVVVYTDEARDALCRSCGADPAKVTVVPHGMTVRPVGPHGPTGGRPTFFTFGFLHPDKGIEVLLGAARLLQADPFCPPFTVLVAGEARARRGVFRFFGRADQSYAQQLERLINDRLSDVVVRRSYLADEELDELLQTCLAFVAPYRHTTQSGAVNRAAGAGAAIVASDLPGLRSSLGDSACWVVSDDPAALATALRSLLDDSSEAEHLRAASRAAHAGQSMEVTAALQAAIWRRLVQRPGAAQGRHRLSSSRHGFS
jgi:glycosyltransferase involved in cell wall biosynthesis